MTFWSSVRARGGLFALSLAVIALDQVTKILAHEHLRGRAPVEIVPDFFNLIYSRNAGGLFGAFRDLGTPWRTLLLTLLPSVAVLFMAGFLARTQASDRTTLFGLSLILGGAVGNLIDRIVRGDVIDFLDVYVAAGSLADRLVSWFGTSHWPTFNVADSAIVTGACLLLFSIVRPGQPVGAPRAGGTLSPAAGSGEPS